jgi:hypothetical protein
VSSDDINHVLDLDRSLTRGPGYDGVAVRMASLEILTRFSPTMQPREHRR